MEMAEAAAALSRLLKGASTIVDRDYEFCQRDCGIISVCRIVPDDGVNKAKHAGVHGP